ncbi:MAG: hypothetical protein PHY56_05405 [Candidatus Omnitrophica bacterium]|nr:hypothetical protein [Candidatus Omnitrophota bacterium]
MRALLLLLLVLLLSGCAALPKYDYWDYETVRLYKKLPVDWKCVQRSEYLSKELQRASISHDVIVGLYKVKPHQWIEIKGRILDPSQFRTDKSYYKERWKITSYHYEV